MSKKFILFLYVLWVWNGVLLIIMSPGRVFGQEALSYVVIFADHNAGSAPLTVNFGANLTNPYGDQFPVTYEWDFGDGAASTKKSTRHTFTAAGSYTVTLQVTIWKSPKLIVEDTFTVTVIENLGLTIGADVSSGDVPHAVAFTSTVTGAVGNVAYQWEFGDETVSAEAEPGHTFNSPGTYPVTCTVTDSAVPPRTIQATTQIDVYAILELSIAADTQSGNVPLAVNFTSTVSGAAGTVNYVWEFGDESASTNAANPTHTYDYAGAYTATCTVTDSAIPPRSAQATAQIKVLDNLGVSIAADTLSGDAPLTVNFTSTVTGTVDTVNYTWEYGDGSTETVAEPSHTFNSPGTYPVTCTVSDSTVPSRSAQASIDVEVTWGNLAVCIEEYSQANVQIAPDGAGGALIVWQDRRSGSHYDIYAQKLGSDGSLKWTANGVAVCLADGDQDILQVAPDGVGGALITWQDKRGGTYYDIYAQRLDVNGKPQWTSNGEAVCTAEYHQLNPRIVSDGAGGAIIVWEDNRDYRETAYNIYAQRLDAEGKPQWLENGILVCGAPYIQALPDIVPDGAGGVIITWQDNRNLNESMQDIYAQRLAGNGESSWTQDGLPVCTAANDQLNPQIAADGSGGVIITWQDNRNSENMYDIYAQRLAGNGEWHWVRDGVAICTAPYYQEYPQLVDNGSGGAVITWRDKRSNSHYDIYVQRVDGDGNLKWARNGEAVCTLPNDQNYPQLVSDGSGGAVITWQDYRSGSETHNDIYAQAIGSDATLKWAENGLPVCLKPFQQMNPRITYYDSGGAVIVWYDYRSGNYDIYAQRVNKDGILE